MGDEDDAFQTVDFHQELELVDDAFFLEGGLGVAGEAGRAAGECDAVVAGEAEALLEEVVEVLAESAIGAVDRRGVDAGGFVGEGGDIRRGRGAKGLRGRGVGGGHVDLDGAART